MTEPHLPVDVLVRQIHTAGECRVAINHCNLTMITVILIGRKHRAHRREHFTADSIFFQLFRVSVGHQRQAAHAIIHKTYLHTRGRFLLQNFQNAVPHLALFHDKIFHENVAFRFLQFLQKYRIHIIAQREILRAGILPDGVSAILIHIVSQPCRTPALPVQPLHNLRLLL